MIEARVRPTASIRAMLCARFVSSVAIDTGFPSTSTAFGVRGGRSVASTDAS